MASPNSPSNVADNGAPTDPPAPSPGHSPPDNNSPKGNVSDDSRDDPALSPLWPYDPNPDPEDQLFGSHDPPPPESGSEDSDPGDEAHESDDQGDEDLEIDPEDDPENLEADPVRYNPAMDDGSEESDSCGSLNGFRVNCSSAEFSWDESASSDGNSKLRKKRRCFNDYGASSSAYPREDSETDEDEDGDADDEDGDADDEDADGGSSSGSGQ